MSFALTFSLVFVIIVLLFVALAINEARINANDASECWRRRVVTEVKLLRLTRSEIIDLTAQRDESRGNHAITRAALDSAILDRDAARADLKTSNAEIERLRAAATPVAKPAPEKHGHAVLLADAMAGAAPARIPRAKKIRAKPKAKR